MSDMTPDCDRRAFLRLGLAAATLGANSTRLKAAGASSTQAEADAFLAAYVKDWLPKETAAAVAAWNAATDVTEAHTAETVARTLDVNRVVGSKDVIAEVKALLEHRADLNELTVRQLEKARLRAAESPGSLPEVVKARAEAEAKQSAAQDGFIFPLADPEKPDRKITANGIDRVLVNSKDLSQRRAVWETSKEIGRPLRAGLLRLRELRNTVARELGFSDYFALQVADFGLTVPEMIALTDGILDQIKPLYAQLHTWAKHELAKRYQTDPPAGKLPAHWLPNRWGQNWPSLVEGVDMDAPFKGKNKEFITEQAERFYVSLGFPKLPGSFWEKSDLYPVEPPSKRLKNSHASAWHIDLRDDVRSLMSIEPDSRWFGTAHHELGHIYYYMSYSTPKVPYLLRAGANRAFHEAIGDLISIAAGQRPYLKRVGLLSPAAEKADPVTFLLDTALDGSSLVFLPWAAGVMTRFERDFYAGDIPDDGLNAAWWKLVGDYQGIAPPGPRPEDLCDPATKTHINDDAAQYYDYALATVIKFQLHDHIARVILKQDPTDCDYFGSKPVGAFLRSILELGATRDWNAVLREATGSGLSAQPLLNYFAPLSKWLADQNQGRAIGWS